MLQTANTALYKCNKDFKEHPNSPQVIEFDLNNQITDKFSRILKDVK